MAAPATAKTTKTPTTRLGRKSKYTPATVKKIVHALELGATHELAQNYAGVGHTVFYEWMNSKPAFAAAVRQAEGVAAVKWLSIIEEAAPNNWQAAAWKLERRYPQLYGRTIQQQVQSGEVQHRLIIEYVDDWRAPQRAVIESIDSHAESSSTPDGEP